TPIPVSARMEQTGIDAQPSALRSRLGRQGQVLRRRATRLTFLERVADEVRISTALREVIALAKQASALTDPRMRARLRDLAGTARAGCPECRSTEETPAVHRLRLAPAGQPVPEDPATGVGAARPAAQDAPAVSPQGANDAPMLMVRYHAGTVGEMKRTVHTVPLVPASRSAEGMLTALCSAILSPTELEVVAFREGMPCLASLLR